jgi:hypothetical protein
MTLSLSLINPIHTISPYLFNINFNIIIPAMSRFSNFYLRSGFKIKLFIHLPFVLFSPLIALFLYYGSNNIWLITEIMMHMDAKFFPVPSLPTS